MGRRGRSLERWRRNLIMITSSRSSASRTSSSSIRSWSSSANQPKWRDGWSSGGWTLLLRRERKDHHQTIGPGPLPARLLPIARNPHRDRETEQHHQNS